MNRGIAEGQVKTGKTAAMALTDRQVKCITATQRGLRGAAEPASSLEISCLRMEDLKAVLAKFLMSR